MSERSFGNHDDPFLSTGPAGDVVAARRLAKDLIGSPAGPCTDMVDPVLATLVLTAACLHTAAISGDVRRADLAQFLTRILDDGAPGPALFRSSMQFVRYAAHELQALPSRRRACLLQNMIRMIGGNSANTGRDENDKKAPQVII